MKKIENIREEVRKDFQENTDWIGFFIFLTKFVKNLNTRTAAVIVSGLTIYPIAIFFYNYLNLNVLDIFIIAVPGHIIGYIVSTYVMPSSDDTYKYFKEYQEALEDKRDGKL